MGDRVEYDAPSTHSPSCPSSPSSRSSCAERPRWLGGEDLESGITNGTLTRCLTSAIAGDLSTQQQIVSGTLVTQQAPHKEDEEGQENAPGNKGGVSSPNHRVCCICGDAAVYTCPGCAKRTCSITCVRVHKKDFKCTGERDVAKMVPLNEFTDTQLLRDYRFIEDVRRVVGNCGRNLTRVWRYTFRALPPPLHALREAAKRRGVVCQITSEGMSKRDANTSRYDRRTETITWRCCFNFHGATGGELCVSTDWGSERHRLGDIVAYSWATNPPLPCFHINRQYNRASKWIGTTARADAETERSETHAEDNAASTNDPPTDPMVTATTTTAEEAATPVVTATRTTPTTENVTEEPVEKENEQTVQTETTATPTPEEASLPFVFMDAEETAWRPCHLENAVPTSDEEATNRRAIEAFFSDGPFVILSRAERLGSHRKYFRMFPSRTLNEALRTLFFINEFPVFDVVRVKDLAEFPLVTEADKESIRESFRMTPRPPKPERPPRRTKSELSPEEMERYARVPCRMFLAGSCKMAEGECPYWHCEYKDVPACRNFTKFAMCEKGERCSFRHDQTAVTAARRRSRDERQHNSHAHHPARRRFRRE